MPIIMKNNVAYAGSYDNQVKQLKLAEYIELEKTGKTNSDTVYFIEDANEELAKNIAYDNTDTGLEATDMQGAIDELNSNMGNINIYVGTDSKLHFVDSEGADSVLPFSSKSFYSGIKGQYNPAGTHKFRIDTSGSYLIAASHDGGTLYAHWFIQNGKITYEREGTSKTDTYKFTASLSGTTLSLTATGIPYYSYMWSGDKDLIEIPVTSQSGSQAVSFMGGGSDSVSYTVTFPKAFSSIPTVTLSPVWTSNGGWVDYVQAKNVTTTGFTLFVQSLGGASSGKGIKGTVSWVASV